MIVLWSLHLIPLLFFLVFLFLAVGMGIMLSTNAIFLEELSFQMYPRVGQQLRLFVAAVLENLGYRQLIAFWRVIGVLKWLFSGKARSHWGQIARDGAWQHRPLCARVPRAKVLHARVTRTRVARPRLGRARGTTHEAADLRADARRIAGGAVVANAQDSPPSFDQQFQTARGLAIAGQRDAAIAAYTELLQRSPGMPMYCSVAAGFTRGWAGGARPKRT